jgi:lipoyl(octanoyl) transferase
MSDFRVLRLGTMPYLEAWALQKQMAEARGRDEIPDTLLFVEHPHVYTLGSAGQESNLVWSEEERRANGVELHRVDRGGDVTYHGPGQLVGYPILKLPRGSDGLHADVIAYIRSIETVLIRALDQYGVRAFPIAGLTGVWVGDPSATPAKIAAVGVKVTTRAVTLHGFALNINPDLRYFAGIIPCGISDKPVTSLAQQLGATPPMDGVIDAVAAAFAEIRRS